jgi:mannosyltransferase OCH1-like enzyme
MNESTKTGIFCLLVILAVLTVLAVAVTLNGKHNKETFSDENWISIGSMGFQKASDTWATDEIPKIIHQLAPADRSKWNEMWHGCHMTWQNTYSGHVHMMWTDEAMQDFCIDNYPVFYNKIYSMLTPNIKKVDVFRYIILYHFGGLYADMDYECVHDFWHMLRSGKANIAESSHAGEGFQNALMASPARHPFWHYVMSEVISAKDIEDVLLSTGPQVIVRAVSLCPIDMFNALPASEFSVYSLTTDIKVASRRADKSFVPTTLPGVYAAHHGTGHWGS